MAPVKIYDTTLRDGAQRAGISFSVEDKIKIAGHLDSLGVHFIEGGWPGANPKDTEFFARARDLSLHASVVAFGSTRRARTRADEDPTLRALADAGVKTVTVMGKSSEMHVTQVIGTTLEENLAMVADSIGYLKSKGYTVFFDAEHFFDGFLANSEYSLSVLKAAADAGAECLVLCDTNGGSLPAQICQGVEAAKSAGAPLGIHTHNDGELAVANTLAAVQCGASQVQGTINGYGERCGNANLCSIIADLKLKLGIDCISDQQLARLTEVARNVSEIANLSPDPHLPYVGSSAFSHKAGLHVSGMMKHESSYQHVKPDLVGNRNQMLMSELAGGSTVLYKAKQLGLDLSGKSKQVQEILERVKMAESQGFQYEVAEASFELLLRRAQPGYKAPFDLVDFMVVVEKRRRRPANGNDEEMLSEAMVKVRVSGEVIHTVAEGNGPVNALDAALRKALLQYYPSLAVIKLVDYKVRILEESEGTESQVRVLIDSSDGEHDWRTVGSSTNIIEASWLALSDSLEYWLLRQANPR